MIIESTKPPPPPQRPTEDMQFVLVHRREGLVELSPFHGNDHIRVTQWLIDSLVQALASR